MHARCSFAQEEVRLSASPSAGVPCGGEPCLPNNMRINSLRRASCAGELFAHVMYLSQTFPADTKILLSSVFIRAFDHPALCICTFCLPYQRQVNVFLFRILSASVQGICVKGAYGTLALPAGFLKGPPAFPRGRLGGAGAAALGTPWAGFPLPRALPAFLRVFRCVFLRQPFSLFFFSAFCQSCTHGGVCVRRIIWL